MTINPNLFPPCGYNFVDADKVVHVDSSLELLVESLRKYRARLSRPAGNPREEITEQLCRRHPQICFQESSSGPSIKVMPHDGKQLAARVVATTNLLLREGHRNALMPAGYVSQRVRQCESCPANVDWASHCAPCQQKVKDLLPQIVKPAKPVAELEGRACLCAHDDLSVAVHLKTPRPVLNAPGRCWRSVE